jgi:deoxyribodipyrimidine photo-lyase
VPAASDHYQVFTPYYRRWMQARWRRPMVRPRRVRLPADVSHEPLRGGWLPKPALAVASVGGSTPGRRRLGNFLRTGLVGYGERDQLADPSTSRLSAYLHFGCLSPLEVALAAAEHEDAGAFLRQLCWRDFFIQVMAARTEVAWSDVRPRGATWANRPRHLARWQEGSTGFPVVDAAMRQLSQTGTMPNRARMVVASFLTHDLGIDWRLGARHFLRTLIDGDVVVNNLNWQWVAGTGTDRSPRRVLNPTRQGLRFDPAGSYVRHFVPELRSVRDRSVHDPDPDTRRRLGYPMPVSDDRGSRA